MGREKQPISNGQDSFEVVQIRDDKNKVVGNAAVFRDPYLMGQTAWRELFRTHVFSEEPAKIAMMSHGDEVIQISFDELWNLRDQSLRQRRRRLNEMAFQAQESKAVVLARDV